MGEKKEVREVFLAAVACDTPEERNRYLDEACRGKPELRQRVEVLLRAHEQAGDFLESAVGGSPGPTQTVLVPITEKAGDKIGPYKLLQQIGEGGCGVVYMAEQAEPIRRKVALKVIKLGMDTKQVIARFEAERQALALMDHPNIARVLDAGATATGRPYFVMELVRGQRITEYCDENSLDTEARLGLFMQVCHAIQHAHQKGIIHRDIKPSNILVTVVDGQAVPKVIDFGIAKAMGQQLTDKTLFTAFEQFIGTPAYMSPEQAALSGVDVDTRSDIYSLGVLLYELLTGHTPFDPKTLVAAGLDEMRRMIRESEPPKPSTRISTLDATERTTVAKHRQAEPAALTRLVRGDLDWIVMKCLEKDRGRRYETANNVALDIEHHLRRQPVSAAAPSRVYRAQKFIRRHKAGLAAAAALVLLLAAGVVVSTWQAVRATRAEREQARLRQQAEAARVRAEADEKKAETEATRSAQAARFLKDMLESVPYGVALGQDTKLLRGILDKTAERLGKDLTNQPDVEAELRLVVGTTYRDIGLPAEAEAMTREALRLSRTALGETNLLVAHSLIGLASVLIRFGGASKGVETEGLLRQAIAIQRQLHDPDGKAVADAMDFLSRTIRGRQAKLTEAEALTREALALRQKLFGREHYRVAKSLNNLGLVLRNQDKLDEAEATIREAMAILKKIPAPAHPELTWSLYCLATVLERQGKLAEAEAAYRQELTMDKILHDEDNWYADSQPSHLAAFFRNQGKQAELEALLREAVERRRGILGHEHPHLAISLADLANALLMAGKFTEAESVARECLAICQKKLPDDWLAFQAQSLLGGSLLGQKRYAEAEPLLSTGYAGMLEREEKSLAGDQWRRREAFDRLVKLYEATGRSEQAAAIRTESYRKEVDELRKAAAGNDPEALEALARFLRGHGKPTEAEPVYRQLLELRRKLLGDEHLDVARSLADLAHLLRDQGKLAEAEALLREALAARKKLLGEQHLDVASSLADLAWSLRTEGKLAEAEPLCREALAVRRKLLASKHPDVAWSLADLAAVLARQGKLVEAEPLYAEVAKLWHAEAERGKVGLQNRTVWLLATYPVPALRDGVTALRFAEAAVAATGRTNAMYLDTLAAAHAEAGQFDKAVTVQKEAMALLTDEKSKQDYASRLKLYESNTPYHAPE